MNGTHRKLKLVLKAITVDERAYVRELTTNAANPWEAKLDELTAIDKHLLAVGITVLVGQNARAISYYVFVLILETNRSIFNRRYQSI
jgi:hypothetical protein